MNGHSGVNPELIEGDVFKIIVKYNDFEKRPTNTVKLTPVSGVESGVESGAESGAESEMASKVLSILMTGPMGKAEIARKLGKSKPTRYLNELVAHLVQQVFVQYTIPEKPNSRMQKYRLTEKGKQLLKKMELK